MFKQILKTRANMFQRKVPEVHMVLDIQIAVQFLNRVFLTTLGLRTNAISFEISGSLNGAY